MLHSVFNFKSQIFPFFTIFSVWDPGCLSRIPDQNFSSSWIRIRITNTDPDRGKQFQYGSAKLLYRGLCIEVLGDDRPLNFFFKLEKYFDLRRVHAEHKK